MSKPRESSTQTLGQLLDEAKMQVTFTGWKAELEALEIKYQRLLEANKKLREGLEFYADENRWDIRRVNVSEYVRDVIFENDLDNRTGGKMARLALSEADKIEGGE